MRKKILAMVLSLAMLAGVTCNMPASEVYANTMSSAEEINLGDIKSGNLNDNNNEMWYKFTVPNDVKDQTIAITFMPGIDYKCSTDVYLYDGGEVIEHLYLSNLDNNKGLTIKAFARSEDNGKEKPVVFKGKEYYIKLGANALSDLKAGLYELTISGDTSKENTVSITASKGKNAIAVDTVPGAKVTVKITNSKNKSLDKITKTVTADSDGIAKVKISRKLQSGDKIVVTSKKTGYETKKKTKKIK